MMSETLPAEPLIPVGDVDPVVIEALKAQISVLKVLLKNANAQIGPLREEIVRLRAEIKTQDDLEVDQLRIEKFDDLTDKVYEFMGW